MEKDLISIIVPVYNTEQYLNQCLDSLLNQTYKNIEIIIIDDGSTDNSKEVLCEYEKKDLRIKIISQENQGLSKTRNVGFLESTGEYVMFLDSDDWIDVETCYAAVNEMKKNDVDVVMWSYIREYQSLSKPVLLFDDEQILWDKNDVYNLYQRMVGLVNEQLECPQKTDSLITAWGKLYKRSVIKDVEFVDTKIIGTEDALYNICVFSHINRAIYIPNMFMHYRKTNPNSLTHKYKKNLVNQWKELYKRIWMNINIDDEKLLGALSNRICLGLIGLGINLAEDKSLSFKEKNDELKNIINMSHYQKSLKKLELKYFPPHWKVFFYLAKNNHTYLMCGLLCVMSRLRGK